MSTARRSLLFYAFLLLTFIFNNDSFCGDGIKMDLFKQEEEAAPLPFVTEQMDIYKRFEKRIEEGRAISFEKEDFEGYFGGMVKIQYFTYSHMSFLNNKIPDSCGAFKQTIDLIFDLKYGQKKYGHTAFETFLDLRSKSQWGVIGAYRNTSDTEVKLGDLSLGEHSHKSSRPIPWFKDSWMQFSFNSALKLESKNLQFFKIGWFPFDEGRGIALGSAYALIYEGLGVYSYIADTSAPGISINGELVKDRLFYDLYYAKFENKSNSVFNTYLNTIRKNQIGRESNPWRGEAKDEDLIAAKLKWTALNDKKSVKLELEPYVYYDEASDQKVEVPNDSKIMLGAYGLSAEYKNSGFEIGGDIAFNYGHESLFALDRNQTMMKVYDNTDNIPASDAIINNGRGAMYEAYNYVVYMDGKNAPINIYTKAAAKNNIDVEPGTAYAAGNPDKGEAQLTNKYGRVRPGYRVNLDGWMGVADMSYDFHKYHLKVALGFMFASGDMNPHEKGQEHDKEYHGFIGLHEIYNGKRVKSALLAGERAVRKPFSLEYDRYENPNYTDPVNPNYIKDQSKGGYYAKPATSFTDMVSIGTGFTWHPEGLNLNPNVLCFWKDKDSAKYFLDIHDVNKSHTSSASDKASKFLGTEFNIIFDYKILKDLTFGGIFAIFFPGQFFKDIKGVPHKNDYFRANILGKVKDANPADYRMSDDAAMFTDISLTYKF